MNNIPTITKNLLIINVAVFVATYLFRSFGVDLNNVLGLHFFLAPDFHIYQLFTYMFMHGGFWHLFFNMYTLFIFGCVLERVWGPKKFLLFYFVTGLGAALLHTGVEWIQAQVWLNQIADGNQHAMVALHQMKMTPTVGASGAIYGVLLGYAMLYPDSVMTLLFPPISLKAKWFVLIFAGIELLTGVTGTADGVAHFAHLGGMLFGWLLILWWRKRGKLY